MKFMKVPEDIQDLRNVLRVVTPPETCGEVACLINMPKRGILEFFKGPQQRNLRLDNGGHLRGSRSTRRCPLCDGRSTAFCQRCNVTLCTSVFKGQRTSCWHKWHNSAQLVLAKKTKSRKRGRRGSLVLSDEQEEKREDTGDDEEDGDAEAMEGRRRSQRLHQQQSLSP